MELSTQSKKGLPVIIPLVALCVVILWLMSNDRSSARPITDSDSSMPSTEPTASTEQKPTSFTAEQMSPAIQRDKERRQALRNAWLEQAEAVAKKAKDSVADNVLTYIKEHMALAAPHTSGGVMMLDTWKKDPPFALVPLLPEDAAVSQLWSAILAENGMAAVFHPANDISQLVLKEDGFSPEVKGVIFLHEGHHAMSFGQDRYDWKDERTFCERERDTNLFQSALLLKLGGKTYQNALNDERARIRKNASRDNAKAQTAIPNPHDIGTALDAVFGPKFSERDNLMRANFVWVHAVFLYFAETYPADAGIRQAMFICTLFPH